MLIFLVKQDIDGSEPEICAENEMEYSDIEGGEASLGMSLQVMEESGFYDSDIYLTAVAGQEGNIYYTSDGSLPDSREGGSTRRYKEPILLTAGEEESVMVYRFRAVFSDGTESEVVTNTYIMGKNVGERYDTMVISLAAKEDDLYGYENGIFVEGKLRADWEAEHPGEEVTFDAPANYNVRGKESERDVHIEIFDEDGRRVIEQDGGIRISGNFTRQSEQKSFKLIARKEYDEIQNRFCYPFFADMRSYGEQSIMDRYKSLKIRNTGNDRSEGFIRDELGMRLAAQTEFPDVQSVRPVSVYINGIYQGLYWMHSTYDEEYFEEKYGEFEGEMVVIGSSETNMGGEPGSGAEERCAAEYNELYAKYSAMDLREDEICGELNSYIDLENYLQYFALEIYMANRDWPYNNIQAYRYVAAPGEGYRENSVFDGRYRYLLYDVDTTMGLGTIRDSLNPDQSFETLALLEERGYAPLFTALMAREDCRQYFVSCICDLLNGAYSTENVAAVLEDMHRERENEMLEYIEESIRNPELPEIGEPYLEMQMDCIKAWAETAPESMLEGMRLKWQMGEIYTVYLSLMEGEGARINGITVTEPEFTGRYLTGCDTWLKPVLPAGKEFAYWEINGEYYAEEEILIDEGMLVDGILYAALYTEETDAAGLELSAISAKGEHDYIILTNTSGEDVNTRGYCLMDKEKTSHMNYLEQTVLAPQESILIGCKNYDGDDAFMKVNFNLKKGEEVILSYAKTGVTEKVEIPDLGMEEGIYRKNKVTGLWQEESAKEASDGT
ncbi:hypothetical protein D3Z45_07815 [Lachnospiraceae bacterium]|nr:hypothetical protein [Lachnospiraceae bacterium]